MIDLPGRHCSTPLKSIYSVMQGLLLLGVTEFTNDYHAVVGPISLAASVRAATRSIAFADCIPTISLALDVAGNLRAA